MTAPAAQFPAETDARGAFVRQQYRFRDRITADDSSGYPAEAGRYHLYVSLACPWAHRAVIVRKLLGLEDVVSMSVVDPVRDERGWAFREGRGHGRDSVCNFDFLSEAYLRTDPAYEGRYTVPCVWDRVTKRLVTNNYPDITIDFETQFTAFHAPGLAGLVLVAPSPPTPEPMTEASRAHTRATYGDHTAAVETARRITRRPLAPAAFDQVVADNLRTSRPAWDAWMLEGSLENLSARMPHVDVPALVVAGGADPVMEHAMLEREVRDRIAGARMVDVADVGHLVPLEAPAELAAAVGDFGTALPARA